MIGYVDDIPGTIEELLTKRAVSQAFGISHAHCRVNALDQSRSVVVTRKEVTMETLMIA